MAVFFFCQTQCNQFFAGDALFHKGAGQLIPAVRCKAQLKGVNRIARYVTLVKIGQPRFPVMGLYQAVMEEIPCHFIDFRESVPQFIAGYFFSRPFDDGQGNMGPFGQSLDGVCKGKVFFFHNELKNVAMGMAAEAVEKSLIGRDAEGRRLFIMERTAGPKIAAPSVQRDVIRDDADDVIGLANLFNKFAGKPFHSLSPALFQLS